MQPQLAGQEVRVPEQAGHGLRQGRRGLGGHEKGALAVPEDFGGDLIVGDRDGVVVLPQEKISPAIAGLQAIREKERKIEALIAEGLTKPDWVREYLTSDGVQYID